MDLEEPDPSSSSSSSSSATLIANGSSSSSASGPSISQVQEEENNRPENENQNQQTSHVNNSLSEAPVSEIRDDVWSCLIVLVSFWFFASTTVILCFYGSSNLQLGPNCSRLIQTVPFFVESIKVEELEEAKPGPMLYGFDKPPPLDVEITWTETHKTFVPVNFHKEWSYFLNKGSRIDVMLHTKSPSSPPLVLVIAKGKESMIEWIDSSYPNTTLSWNIIHGSGKIHQEIPECSSYYIALGNLNSEDVEVELEFTIKALLYNTTKAYYKCSLGNRLCSLKLSLLGAKTAVLTSPPHDEYSPAGDDWYVKLSYGPRWFTYFIGSGLMTMIILLAFRFCNKLQNGVVHRGEPERAPLLFPKDDNNSSCGSSYDSLSHEEEDQEEWQAPEGSLEAKAAINEGENNNNIINARRLCVICFDSPRDCFFLPCGHCASCLTCGTRIAEETGVCPICRRKMKKVRKIFTV